MFFTADYLLGRVYAMPIYRGNTIAGSVNVTITGYGNRTVRVHCDNGERATWELDDLIALIEGGQLVEAPVAPTVLPREPAARFRRHQK